ncbi:MAG TPA: terminase [Mycobacteriales bacterium]|nr:terminase [Mycobacteriales bacterium]
MRLAKRRTPQTKRGLLPEAKHLVLPAGIVASGFPRVEAICKSILIEFDPWQRDLNRCILAKGSDGQYAADIVALSIGRQVGKTWDVGAVCFAECIAVPETTVVWTAHRFKVARESFDEHRGMAQSPKLAAHIDIDEITTGAGNECIPFRNGSRIVYAARERGSIRGFRKVRILVLDEAQILTEAALSDLAPTQNQATNPLLILMGTPPKPTDPGDVFTRIRAEALSGETDATLYVEIGAQKGCDPDDRNAWREANPSYPKRTPARAIQRLRRLLSLEDFLREALGIWDSSSTGVLDIDKWRRELADPAQQFEGTPPLGLDMTPDRAWCSIGAGAIDGKRRLVELVEHRRGSSWVVDWFTDPGKPHRRGYRVAIMPGSPAGSLIEPLRAAGVAVFEVSSQEYAHGCGAWFDAFEAGTLRHRPHPDLDAAVEGARVTKREAWTWDRRSPNAVISPLVAVTLAAQCAAQPREAFFAAAWR